MTQPYDQAAQSLLEPHGLDTRDLEQTLARIGERRVDDGDVFLQQRRHESWSLEDGRVKEGMRSLTQGLGVRAVHGDQSGFAYADEITRDALLEASGAARGIVRSVGEGRINALERKPFTPLYSAEVSIDGMPPEEKVQLLNAIDREARRQDPRVKQVMVSLAAVREATLVAAMDGTLAGDIRPLLRINVSVIAEQNGRRETGFAGGGGRRDFDYFTTEGRALGYAREAVRQALLNLEAVDAPAGTMPVVLGPGWPGVLLHEAIGHGLEGDFNRKKTSAFAGRLGETVASPLCTVIDDGTMSERRGSLSVDDEGTPTHRTVLIEEGRLIGYMQDKLNARLMGMPVTGNGRRESYAHLPMPRMTNTYMLPGEQDPQELFQGIERGLYAVNFGGGQVDITSGKFVFSAAEAYLIEKGKVTRPVRGATLIGHGPEVLTHVTGVGNDLALDPGIGVCGKEGQSVPVGVGQPSLRVEQLTVGGTQA